MNHLIFFAIQLLSLSPVWKVAHCQGWNMVFLIRVHWSRSRCWPAMAGSLIKKEATLVRTLAVTTPLVTLKFHMVPSWHLHSPVQHLRKAMDDLVVRECHGKSLKSTAAIGRFQQFQKAWDLGGPMHERLTERGVFLPQRAPSLSLTVLSLLSKKISLCQEFMILETSVGIMKEN